MTEQPPPQGATITLPPQSANGTSPQLPPAPAACVRADAHPDQRHADRPHRRLSPS